jgi:hypothetical protein
MLARGYDAAIYLDPDIRLFGHPDPVVEALLAASVVLTPHALAPLMDGRRPSDIDLMRNGVFNLGFIAIRRDSIGCALLDWWEDRCLSFGFNDAVEGLFVDQKWLNFAVCYFDRVHVLKHRGCNAAYWNLHERSVSQRDGRWLAGEDPLIFFHFSGVDPSDPSALSRYQNRHALADDTPLAQMVRGYCTALAAAKHPLYGALGYSFARLSDGRPITTLMRRALLCAGLDEAQPFDAESPFQKALVARGIAPRSSARPAKSVRVNAFNFDPSDLRVRSVNTMVRMVFRALGMERASLLLRYLTFLSRGSNLAAVLTRRPLVFDHRSRSVGTARQQDHHERIASA